MELSNRLLEIVRFVPKDSTVADIGTDHGYIPVYLIKNNISNKVIASDISRCSLDKTIEYVNHLDLNERILPRLGDGLNVLNPSEVDTVIIAGMGGILISKILENNKEISNTIDNFILQPMVASKELRRYLITNGYIIIDEGLAKEGRRFYEIIYARRGRNRVLKDINYEIGQQLIKKNHPLLNEFIEYKKSELVEIISKLGEKDTNKIKLRYQELTKTLEAYEEVENELKS